ncbi:OadG family protein [Aliidiomarina sp.]|uniref:OadG family protein n=1 Tax=Aliidiomarina sp. TaxID=1872439 RepID=UPI003A4D2928
MADLFFQAFELMLAGMGVVFVFLIVLTAAVTVLTKLCPEPTEASVSASSSEPAHAASANADKLSNATKLAAVTVAVQRYRAARDQAKDEQE